MSFHTLHVGATALIAQKYALDTTGHNIANAATPGYTRQRLNTGANRPIPYSFGALGNGVQVKSIQRIADEFLEKQVRLAKGTNDRLAVLQDGYENLQVFFNELTENDISTAMDNLWDAVSDLVNNVEDISTRRALLERGRSLANSFREIDRKIYDYRLSQNEQVRAIVGDINAMLKQISTLNQDILKIESGGVTGVTASDLRDERTELLKKLAGLMDITVTEEPNGSATVTQKSRLLVYQNKYYELTTRRELSDDLLIDTPVFAEDNDEVTLKDGKLYGHIYMRDTVLKGYRDMLDQLAGSFAWEFNRIHSQGVGLKGFSRLTARNAVVNPAATLDKLNYGFIAPSNTFQIVNGNFEIIVHDERSDEEIRLNIEIDLDGRGAAAGGEDDTILYDPLNPSAAHALVNKLQAAFDSIHPGLFTVSLDNSNHLQIVSTTEAYTFAFGRDTSGVLAALGLNVFFTGYDAGSIALDDELADNPDLIAAARSFTPGDNSGAKALVELRDTPVLNNRTATLQDYYEGLVGRLGIEAARIESFKETQKDILAHMENQREDLSGVNLDEELTKMIQFQRSFQSAARFISVADTIYETLINM